MNTTYLPNPIKLQDSVTLSIVGDDIDIDNPLELTISDESWDIIAEIILSWFYNGKLNEHFYIEQFKSSIFGGMPIEGGVIPVDNVIEWIEHVCPTVLMELPTNLLKTTSENVQVLQTA